MNFFTQFLCDFTHGPERASFLEHLFCVLWLGLTIGGLLVILLTVAVWLPCHLHDWWYGVVGGAAAEVDEFLVAPVRDWRTPPVAAAAAPPVGDELGARAVRRRRAARDTAMGEPGSSSGEATEHKKE